ncbi:B-box zinc finger protein 20-like [Cucurbita moschata]|uniref:B-box zinc finger protein 20-like n=1 Tax=Cucurbita moschata TaxID=3662 RepID=A0A6J1FTW5_CUCMO|nr:B-box zinc finger protein 20-like [Cucurbita moschata]
MKIRCDVCNKEEASVFCPSDEAALCSACDHHVHRANKLAEKHSRFTLLRSTPTGNSPPSCDICQVRRAFLFCLEDRAILCRECDIPIHGASEHTQKHSRFLLTGVKVSPSPATSSSSSTVSGGGSDESAEVTIEAEIGIFKASSRKKAKMGSKGLLRGPLMEDLQAPIVGNFGGMSENGVSFSTSNISEYLESLPGWCVEEFLDSSCVADVFCKV